MIDSYVERAFSALLTNAVDKEKIMENFLDKFKDPSEPISANRRWRTACRIISKKLVHDNIVVRRKSVSELLKTIRNIDQQSINDDSFEKGLHTVSSEPYYHDTSYNSPALREETIVDHKTRLLRTKVRSHIGTNEYSLEGVVIAVDGDGKCHLNIEDRKEVSLNTWKCDLHVKNS